MREKNMSLAKCNISRAIQLATNDIKEVLIDQSTPSIELDSGQQWRMYECEEANSNQLFYQTK